MKLILLAGVLLAASSAFAQPDAEDTETDDFYVLGGALRALGDTTWTLQSGFIYRPTDSKFGLGFSYNNDGHLPNNHRDGLAGQVWYVQQLGEKFELQAGTGPYANMNNTNENGQRVNKFEVGLMTSVALKWHVFPHGWYLRTQYNNTWVPGSFNSNALLVGAGCDFTTLENSDGPTRLGLDVSLWGGSSRTTQIGTQKSAAAYQVELQYLFDTHAQWWQVAGISTGLLSEGDTTLQRRTGIPLQFWWSSEPSHVTFSTGVGPYLAYDGVRTENKVNLLGIFSIRVTYKFMETRKHQFEAGFMYTRVASFYNRDEDIFMLGLRFVEKVARK